MNIKLNILVTLFLAIIFSGCVTTTPTIVSTKKPKIKKSTIQTNSIISKPILKRKVAIARFSNETPYGKSTLFGIENDYNMEKQATDILSAKLAQSGKFILLERNDLDEIKKEIKTHNLKSLNIGADYLIVGSITEFGRKNLSDTGVFSRSRIQEAYAKVSLRLINVRTGQIIFAQEGSGKAKSEAGTSFGLGKHVGYDSTLNDKAISAAISSVVDGIVENLLNKPWRSYILSIKNNTVVIAGGVKQGIKVGNVFTVYKKGDVIKNPQTGIPIELPGTKIASIKVISQFGSSYTNEGSICKIVDGSLKGVRLNELYIEK